MTVAIIPCAGFGTRLGMSLNQAKELLPDPNTGKPLIDYSINLCRGNGIIPIVVSRSEKIEFNEYIQSLNIPLTIIEPTGEWPSTVLSTINYWDDHNFLILPDTRFESHDVIVDMHCGLKMGNDCVFGLHHVESSEMNKWGIVSNNRLAEKPESCVNGKAWGIIGWKKNYGQQLFSLMKERNLWQDLKNPGYYFLDKFVDITRNGKVENY